MPIHKEAFEAVPNINIQQPRYASSILLNRRGLYMPMEKLLSLAEIQRRKARSSSQSSMARPFATREDVYAMFDANWSYRTTWSYPTLEQRFKSRARPQEWMDMRFASWISPFEQSFIQVNKGMTVDNKVSKWLASEKSQTAQLERHDQMLPTIRSLLLAISQ
jgi:hypothetical protein